MFEADSSSSLISSSSGGSGARTSITANGAKLPSSNGDSVKSPKISSEFDSSKADYTGEKSEASKVKEDDAQPEQSNMLSSTGIQPGRTRSKAKKVCGVCGDIAKSFHFGGLSCDSCKAFFRRSVHNDAHLGFQCAHQAGCEVTKESRKSCQYCRFQKCIGIGMEKKWVMSEQEKTQLIQQRKGKKDTPEDLVPAAPEAASEAEYEPDVSRMLEFMTADERDEIECIVNKYQHSYREIPFRVSQVEGTRNTVEIIQMFTTILRRFAYFTKLLPEFSQLSIADQSSLLRGSVLEMCLLRGALSFDFKSNRWPKTENMEFLKDCPKLRVEDMEKLVSKDLYEMHMQFINGIQELGADEATVMILLLIVLFYPDRAPFQSAEYIGKVQEKYLLLLDKYVQWRYGPKGSRTFPKLLAKLADLRQLNDSHTEYNLKMTKNEVERIQEQLGNINLNPYPQWVLVEDQHGSDESTRSSAQDYQSMSPPRPGPPHQQQLPEYYSSAMEQQEHQSFPPFQDLYNVSLPHQHPEGQTQAYPIQVPPAQPSPRDFFAQFVNRKIPVLINNPFAPFPVETELANARAFFQNMGASGMGQQMPIDPSASQLRSSAAPAGDQISQFRDILESSDPNMLRQLKESLSADQVSKLQSVFGSGGDSTPMQAPSGPMPFDLSKIPPEMIANYMSGGGMGRGGSSLSPELQQLAAQYGYPTGAATGNAGYSGAPTYDQWQGELHPLAHQSGAEMMQHFHELQQQFATPHQSEQLFNPAAHMETRPDVGRGYSADQQQQDYVRQYFHHQQQQQYQEQYNNWGN